MTRRTRRTISTLERNIQPKAPGCSAAGSAGQPHSDGPPPNQKGSPDYFLCKGRGTRQNRRMYL
jgi:hypothetical protein